MTDACEVEILVLSDEPMEVPWEFAEIDFDLDEPEPEGGDEDGT